MGSCNGRAAPVVSSRGHRHDSIMQSSSAARFDDITGFLASYVVVVAVGKGEYGSVFRCVHKRSGETRAAKIIRKSGGEVVRSQLRSEGYMRRIPFHANLSRQFEFFDAPRGAAIIYEFCSGGEVCYNIEGRPLYTEATVSVIIKGLLRAVKHLHSMHLAHMDVKPQNVLFVRRPAKEKPIAVADVRLVDYGSLTPFTPGRSNITTPAGTPHFAAPEVVAHVCALCAGGTNLLAGRASAPKLNAVPQAQPFDERCDVYSVAVVAFILLVGTHPFVPNPGRDSMPRFFERVLAGEPTFPARFFRLSCEAQNMLQQGLSLDFSKRPSAAEMLACTWLATSGEDEGVVSQGIDDVELAPVEKASSDHTVGRQETVPCTDRLPLTRSHHQPPVLSGELNPTGSGSLVSRASHRMVDLRPARRDLHDTVEATRSTFVDDLRLVCASDSSAAMVEDLRKGLRTALTEPPVRGGLPCLQISVSTPGLRARQAAPANIASTPQPRSAPPFTAGINQALPNIKAVPEVHSEVCSLEEGVLTPASQPASAMEG
eukprot:TRINITY_DN21017_c0_g1_i1.p1 TRINITY_DN21017_c0_g1~~TRINITY_DN21017_c0_g1_i1.p1  ORF type:complete len:543 (+),score=112.86 TRINITY_DN21017_c0_g1_i1:83-1711(+)